MSSERDTIVREYLLELAKVNGGRLTATLVLEDARDPGSPLHTEFEWDDSRAAEGYRLDQARRLIASVKVVVENRGRLVTAPEFVRDPTAQKDQQGYKRLVRIKKSRDQSLMTLKREADRVLAHLRRAVAVAEVLDMDDELRAMLSEMEEYREGIEGAA